MSGLRKGGACLFWVLFCGIGWAAILGLAAANEFDMDTGASEIARAIDEPRVVDALHIAVHRGGYGLRAFAGRVLTNSFSTVVPRGTCFDFPLKRRPEFHVSPTFFPANVMILILLSSCLRVGCNEEGGGVLASSFFVSEAVRLSSTAGSSLCGLPKPLTASLEPFFSPSPFAAMLPVWFGVVCMIFGSGSGFGAAGNGRYAFGDRGGVWEEVLMIFGD